MLKRTSLHDYHKANSKLVEFAGYEMPIWYTSVVEEHLSVRDRAGIFDVSHMGRVIVTGPDASKYVDYLIPTVASTQPVGKSFYTLFLNEDCGIIDDLIVLKRAEDEYLLIINAANTQKDLAHMQGFSERFNAETKEITSTSTMIAVQGPKALQALQPLVEANLKEVKRFRHIKSNIHGSRTIITRTGYTGEDGFEIVLLDTGVENNSIAMRFWGELAQRARPCGLGARDSLRIEAGLPLYGSDIDETTNPIEADLSWVVSKDKSGFIGSERLNDLSKTAPARMRRGVILNDMIPRKGFQVLNENDQEIGRVTSGTFSPVLRRGISLAYLETAYSEIGQSVRVRVRDSRADAKVVKPPFYDETMYGWKRTIG
jgi:aminomethyltransferase